MKFCPRCNSILDDSAKFCAICGASFETAAEPQYQAAAADSTGAQQQYAPPYGAQAPYSQPAPAVDPFDHTSEFDAKDISDNKVIAMLLYLNSMVGILVALLSQNKSEYVAFHLRQALKFMVCSIISMVFSIIPFIGWFVTGACVIALTVVKIICFLDICKGKAKEPLIIRNLKFLK